MTKIPLVPHRKIHIVNKKILDSYKKGRRETIPAKCGIEFSPILPFNPNLLQKCEHCYPNG